MKVVEEQVTSAYWEYVDIWASGIRLTELSRIQAGIPMSTADFDIPPVQLMFKIPEWKLAGLVTLLNGCIWADEPTGPRALAPRTYPEGSECIPPPGAEEGTTHFLLWKECCLRAEKEYISFAKKLGNIDMATCFLPSSVAHIITVHARVDVVYQMIRCAMSYYALPITQPLKPLFRELLITANSFVPRLFGRLYERYILKPLQTEEEDDDAEMADEGEGESAPV